MLIIIIEASTMKNFDIFSTNQDDINEIINLVCMYYARLSSKDVKYKQNKSNDLSILAEHFNLKLSTINNYKDYYDALFENGRKGWYQRSPESYPKLYVTYNKYKELSIQEHEKLTEEIMISIKGSIMQYFSIKTKDPETVKSILSKSSSVVFSGINVLQDKLKVGQPVFIVLGGDKPSWETGLIGMGTITKEPFDIGYDRNNFRVEVDIKLLLNKTIKRADLVTYKDTYDIIGIGPITKWEPNQALSQIDSTKAIALMRAMLDFDKSIESDLCNLVAPEIMQKIKAATPMYNEILVEYGEHIANVTTTTTLQTLTKVASPFSINSIIEHINATGLLYSPSLIKRFAFSLMAKRFLILSGLAGSGKTQLALAFAKALVEDMEKQMRVVSVGADWTNREPLLGYPNALKSGEYVKPENGVLDLLIEANKPKNANKPFFLILDEMNMSYVERYFADFLSAMESHEAIALWKECNNGSESCECNVPERIKLPDNLFIIGTINVDETTYMFSPKVLDRANVIEFKISIDEMDKFLDGIGKIDCSLVSSKAAEMGADFVRLANCKEFENEQATTDTLKAFFTELKSVNAEFGYRSATEIFRFISQAHKNDDTTEKMSKEEVLDAAILQKLLPKLHGSRKKLEPALKGLWKLCFDPSIKDTMQIARENIDKARYKESADKIFRMYESAYANGFTSFAEA